MTVIVIVIVIAIVKVRALKIVRKKVFRLSYQIVIDYN